jgi:hypothetical protein
MASITEEMKAFIKTHQAFVATVAPDGSPNIGPKGSLQVLDEEHLIYYELTGGDHYQNVQRNPKIAVAVADPETVQGYRFQGTAELVTEGPLYEKASRWAERAGFGPPKAVVTIKVEAISSLGMSGAGRKTS